MSLRESGWMGCPRASDEVTPEQRPEWTRVRNCEEGATSGRMDMKVLAGVEQLEVARVTVHWGREGMG